MEDYRKTQPGGENVDFEKYRGNYSPDGFWEKVRNVAVKAGIKVIYGALKLFYASKDKNTPQWAKGVIYGALGYLILPADLVPDVLPAIGFSDDLGVILAALATVAFYVTDEVKACAKDKLRDFFGDSAISCLED